VPLRPRSIHRRLRFALAAACLVAVSFLAACVRSRAPAPATATGGARLSANAVMVRDVDGDTIRVRVGRRVEPVRLLGIDTPETKDPRKPVQCFGKEASARTAALLPRGTPLRLVRDVEGRDRYARLLAYVYRATDGLFVNLALVQEGYAVTLTYPPNVAHAGEFVAAAARARSAGLGLWSRCGGPGVPASARGP
jgi:micrococcal nuclease